MKSRKFCLQVSIVMLVMGYGAIQVSGQAKKPEAASPDQKELYSYTLTMDKIQKLAAAQKDLEALQKSNPELSKTLDTSDSSGSIDELTQKIQKYPPVVATLKKDGLAPREYIVGTLTLIQGGMAVGMKKSGTYKEYPPKMLELVSQANLTFLEQHWTELTKLMPDFSASAGGDGDK